MNGLYIRDARPGDRGAIEAVTLSAYQEYAGAMSENWDLYRQNIVATLAAVEPAAQIVAEHEGGIVGAVLLYPPGTMIAAPGSAGVTPTGPEVRLLAVAPAARGRGVGVALMHECVQRARQSGAAVVTLHTTDVMHAAMRLYERMGFRRDPQLDFTPVPGVIVKGYRFDLEATVP